MPSIKVCTIAVFLSIFAAKANSEELKYVDPICEAAAFVACSTSQRTHQNGSPVASINYDIRVIYDSQRDPTYQIRRYVRYSGIGFRMADWEEFTPSNQNAFVEGKYAERCAVTAPILAALRCTNTISIPSSSEVEKAIRDGNFQAMSAALDAIENATAGVRQ